MHIRPATYNDLAHVVEVANAAFGVEDFVDGPRTSLAELEYLLSSSVILVGLDDGGRLCGAVSVEPSGEIGHFQMLAVHPFCQRGRLGTALVSAAEQCCRERGCNRMEITILSRRAQLLGFYDKLGYRLIGARAVRLWIRLQQDVKCHEIVLARKLD